ncbi:uncharacterized protein HKW66_Vig0022520 [Vigna angularis]|uniref:Uncharacterized protein n=1 Tax=Phaseolus angularis TaxID=3914 RepID=A0A8T0L3N2_PHAAN|nr:uncharacterized protein HKW66_Vig0022520 [Vigna angularis]
MAAAVSKVSGDIISSSFDRIRPPPPPPPDSSLLLATRPPRHFSLHTRYRIGRVQSFVQFALLLEWFSDTLSGDESSVGLLTSSRSSTET